MYIFPVAGTACGHKSTPLWELRLSTSSRRTAPRQAPSLGTIWTANPVRGRRGLYAASVVPSESGLASVSVDDSGSDFELEALASQIDSLTAVCDQLRGNPPDEQVS